MSRWQWLYHPIIKQMLIDSLQKTEDKYLKGPRAGFLLCVCVLEGGGGGGTCVCVGG